MREYLTPIIVGVFGGIALYFAKYIVKALAIYLCIDIEALERVGSRASFVVHNRSIFAAESSSLMITIDDMTTSDIQDYGNTRRTAYISKDHPAFVVDTPTCWAASHRQNPNPPSLDLLSKQSQQAALFNLHNGQFVELASDNCFWDPDTDAEGSKSMVFLKWHSYHGYIRFFSRDSFTKKFEFELNPEEPHRPLKIW